MGEHDDARGTVELLVMEPVMAEAEQRIAALKQEMEA